MHARSPPIDIIDIRETIHTLSELSQEFREFCEEMKVDSLPMIWLHNPDLLGSDADHCPFNDKNAIIFKKIPTEADDIFLVAHEIMHVIRAMDKMPLKIKPNYLIFDKDIASVFALILRNLLEDPVVDRLLKEEYNFDPLQQYENSIIKMRNSLERRVSCGLIGGIFEETQIVFNLCKQKLEWDLIENKETNLKWIEYEARLTDNYQDAVNARDVLVSFIEQVGLDTKEKQRRIFDVITEAFGLTSMVYVQ
jgi:hypothetical protein